MKRLWVLVIAAMLALTACGGDDDSDGNGDNPVLETPTTVAP